MSENSKRCPECGFRVRGPNHKEGRHHQLVKKHMTKEHGGPRVTTSEVTRSQKGGW